MKTTTASLAALAGTLFLAPVPARAQTAPPKWADTLSAVIDRANIVGDLAAARAARAFAERVASAFPDDGLILHYEGYALYCEANLLMAQKQDGWTPLANARAVLERSANSHPLPETYALVSAIDGELIGQDPSRAIELSTASQKAMARALQLGPKNPRVWMIQGMDTFFTPPEYGGGVKPAQAQLLRALELFKTDAPERGEPSWGREEVHVWLGQVYAKMGDTAKAAAEYKAALDLAPDFAFAKAMAAELGK